MNNSNNIEETLKKNKIKYISIAAVLFLLVVIVGAAGLCTGDMKIELRVIGQVLYDGILGKSSYIPENIRAVVWNIRLPRILCGLFVGAGLAVSGVIFQGILQNPLADPYTLGISTGASFGASVAIIINMYTGIYFPTTAAALIAALITLCAVILTARRGSGLESSNLIISGIIVSAVLSSGVSFVKMMAGENVGAIVFWIMGSLSAMNYRGLLLVAPVVSVSCLISAILARQLDIMSLGDENAKALGINTGRLRLIYLIIGSVMTSVCVSVCGVIGFVGLIVPHLLRFWISAENRVLVPLSALFGGVLLMAADNITRVISSGEIPVGVLTTLIGGPFFIFVFTRRGDGKNE